jgi:uncharacterized protein (TIGR03437 family)
MQPGTYYAAINVSATGATNSPQTVTVALNVVNAAQSAGGIQVSSGALLFAGSGQQQVTIVNSGSASKGFATTASTSDGSGWLSVTPALGVANSGSTTLTIAADASASGAGVHSGTVALGFDDGTVDTIQITLTAGGASCTASMLVIVPDQPTGSAAQVGVSQTIQTHIADDCGAYATATGGATAAASFTNGDGSVALADAGGGVWQGTWTPMNAAAQMQIQISAGKGTLHPAALTRAFSVAAADPNGPGIAQGIVNAASGTQPQVVSPGAYIAIYGAQLAATGGALATAVPFPTTLGGTQLFLAGQALPLYYASPGQVNALVPQNLPPNTVLPLVVQRGATRSAPVSLVVAQYQPGLFAQNQAGSGQGSIEISGTALLAAPLAGNARPAQRGTDYIAIYCTGLGPLQGADGESAPADGVAAGYPPLYQTTAKVTVTVGGVDAPVVFSGLTPTLVALYQVDARVPSGAPAGDSVPVIVTVTDPQTGAVMQSNMVTIAVE